MIKVKNIYKENIEIGENDIEFEIEHFEDAQTIRTLRNIKKTLVYSLKNNIGIEDKDKINEITDSILKIHGLHTDNFDFLNQASVLINEKLNNVSIDDNSNKNEKTIKGILKEVTASTDKAIGFDFLYRILHELYGKKEAKRLSGLMYDYSLALSDSTNILIPYCWAMDASKLVTIGRDYGQLHSKPAKRVSSYISALSETVHQMSSHLAGAIAIGTFFLDVAHLLVYKEEISFNELKSDKKIRKYIENEFQQFIHSVNHLSRNGIESPFTNVSIFDRPKLKALLSEGNYDWYFEDLEPEIDEETNENIHLDIWKSYVIEFIIELQNIYMKFFDKGDPQKDKAPYRFPVSTINISKIPVENGFKVEDKKFLKSICKSDIYRYNVFTSEGTKVASCCRLISDTEMLDYASQSNSFGAGGSVSLGSHRVLTLNFARVALQSTSYESFYSLLEKRIEDSAKILKAHKQLLMFMTEKGLQPFISNGWINMNRLFSTFGILGAVEAEEILRKKYKKEIKDIDVMKDFLVFFNDKVSIYSRNYNIIGNIEQIPAESMSHRLANVDKMLYEDATSYPLYANQFIPLWDTKPSIYERMEKDGLYNQLLTGGGIVHINTGEHITSKQAEKLISYSIDSGCEHFAITGTFCQCEDGHLIIGDGDVCKKCGKEIVSKMARTVGFWTPVEDWSESKIKYDHEKRKEYNNGDFGE